MSSRQIRNLDTFTLLRRAAKYGLDYEFLSFEEPETYFFRTKERKNEAPVGRAKLFRFADDCIILLNSDDSKDRVLTAIENFRKFPKT